MGRKGELWNVLKWKGDKKRGITPGDPQLKTYKQFSYKGKRETNLKSFYI